MASATRGIPCRNGFLSCPIEVFSMIVFYVFHAGTARIMKLLCVRIENICDFRSLRCLRSASVNTRCGCLCAFLYAFTCCIIDHDSWLDIERKHIKAQCASVLHRVCFHLYPRSYQIIPGINRCATINHMIFCARNVVRYLRFKYNHAACIFPVLHCHRIA